MRRSTLFLGMFLLAGGMAFAQQQADVPRVISYQGMLASSNGGPLADGEYPVTITMYGDEHGSETVWQDTYTAVVRGGVFSLYLGSGTYPLPAPENMNKSLWIGTRIAGGAELRPLTRLSATPYAINVPDNAITNAKLADGAVTPDKVDMDYISGVTVNGKTVAGKGAVLNIQGGRDIDINYDDATQSLIIGSPLDRDADDARDKRKGDREMLGTQMDAWTLQGDGVNVPTAAVIVPAPGDWIGTSAAAGIPFELRTKGTQIMVYNQTMAGTTPNVVGGGGGNAVAATGLGNVIAGGGGISGVANTIAGERYNTVSGGEGNVILHQFSGGSVIGGGRMNLIGTATSPSSNATIPGGSNNTISNDGGTIGGGTANSVLATLGTVGGGSANRAMGILSTIGGGTSNTASQTNATIGGGNNNQVQATEGTVGGGSMNTVSGASSVIGGGFNNTASFPHSVIGGGSSNRNEGIESVIGGGSNNLMQIGSGRGAIGGGNSNVILGNMGRGVSATIPGGERLTAQSYGQIVMGVGNIPRGNVAVGGAPNDDPILIIGNGTAGGNSNGFEVSYNGHSTVHHNLGAGLPVYLGSTYVDNVVYSWGEVTGTGMRLCDFGVQNVVRMGPGWYRIQMNLQTSTGGPVILSCASVTATLNTNAVPGTVPTFICRSITTSQVGAGNIFDVYISQSTTTGSCVGVDNGFVFKVTARP